MWLVRNSLVEFSVVHISTNLQPFHPDVQRHPVNMLHQIQFSSLHHLSNDHKQQYDHTNRSQLNCTVHNHAILQDLRIFQVFEDMLAAE